MKANNLKKLVLFMFCLLPAMAYTQKGYGIGDNAEDFRLKNVDGNYLSMKIFKEVKGFIIIFTCNHCPYAKAYQERIKDLSKAMLPYGYMVIAINPNDPIAYPEDSYDSMKVRAKKEHFNFPYLWDADQQVATRFGASHTPEVFVLQVQGLGEDAKHIVRYKGAIDDNYEDAALVKTHYVEDAVVALLNKEYPKVESTKAIGCSIKWKKI
jgi:peroxiredoxin